ncbi:amino acid ABC transporter permease [Pyrobaculum neutrophilum]|uniref:Polar amino acid ABC transporter, inner membrane subunit n=1 Tax=Pyrobaculum neutrophilum (strain DSM 2338 / JCM 9278 / NBRC 100436 / V24Sta) TaxID=444157 RepID=B1Y8Z6_PYRNV|nr:amino acid ABC transporter permease [Pyrobaculum neutrophilum]ACB40225.1 polar amino acid ABC transporter, inner membrane subunit [Pyrobaculum neutrophilum V24Sta]
MALQDFIEALPYVAQGIPTTLSLALLSFTIGLLLGAVLLLVRLFLPRPLPWLASAYVEAFRGTPLLVQIFIIYFGVGGYLKDYGLNIDPFTAGVIALGLNSAAYQAEIFRSAVQAIPLEQYLTAEAYAFTKTQTFRYIILPQALRIALPALMNELVLLIKDSSLVAVIGVAPPDIFRRADYYAASKFTYFEAYLAAAVVYFIICYAMVKISHHIERKYAIPGYLRRGVI